MTDAETDAWLERFMARDPGAILEVERLIARIVAFRGFGVFRPEREDLVQESLTQIWEAVALPGFDRGQSFEAFVRTVASRRCLDWRRVRRANVTLSPDLADQGKSPESALSERQRAALGRSLLAGLGEGCRELIRLHAIEDMTYGEIADRWGRTEGALRKQMSGCLARARLAYRRFKDKEGLAT